MWYYILGFLSGFMLALGLLYALSLHYFGPEGTEVIKSKSELKTCAARIRKEGYQQGWSDAADDPIVALRHYAEVSDRLDSVPID